MKLVKLLATLSLLCPTFALAQQTFTHIIIIVQENRTPDNLFQGLCSPPWGNARNCPPVGGTYNIATQGTDPNGNSISYRPAILQSTFDPDHSHASFEGMYNDGGFDQGPINVVCSPSDDATCCPNNASSCTINGIEYYNWIQYVPNDATYYKQQPYNRLDPYLQLATQYGWANFFYQTNEGPSFPAHQFLFSGTSAPQATSNLFAAENPQSPKDDTHVGCTAPNGVLVNLINGSGSEQIPAAYPCFEHPALSDLLVAPLSWRYYASTPGSIWTAPNAIEHICLPAGIGDGTCMGPQWTNNVVWTNTGQILADLGAGSSGTCNLASVSWVTPDGTWSDHGGKLSGYGPQWVGDIVDAVGGVDNTGAPLASHCGYWNNTAVLVTWDDWGGWYDHVEPTEAWVDNEQGQCGAPQGWGCGYIYGFRVPFLFISAYTPQGFVSGPVSGSGSICPVSSGTCYDFGSILQFVEKNFGIHNGIAPLGYTYADGVAQPLDPGFYSGSFRAFTPVITPIPQSCYNAPSQACFNGYAGPLDPDGDGDE